MKVFRDGMVNAEVASECLGVDFCTLLRLVESGRLPAKIEPSGSIRIDPAGIDALLARSTVVPLRRADTAAAA